MNRALPFLLACAAPLAAQFGSLKSLVDKATKDAPAPAAAPVAAPASSPAAGPQGKVQQRVLPEPGDTAPGWTKPFLLLVGTRPELIGNMSGGIALSEDEGRTWQLVNKTPRSEAYRYFGAAAGNGRVVVVTEKGALWSRDGRTWQPAKGWPTVMDGILNGGVAFGDGFFVAVGQASSLVVSKDGDTWTALADAQGHNRTLDPDTNYGRTHFEGVTFLNGKFLVTGNRNRCLVLQRKGEDLVVVNAANHGAITDQSCAVAFGNNRYVMVASEVSFHTSDPAAGKWTEADGKSVFGGHCVMWTGKEFIAGASHGTLYRSADGDSWEKLGSWGLFNFRNVFRVKDTLYAMGNQKLLRSANGKDWDEVGFSGDAGNMSNTVDLIHVP